MTEFLFVWPRDINDWFIAFIANIDDTLKNHDEVKHEDSPTELTIELCVDSWKRQTGNKSHVHIASGVPDNLIFHT